MKITIIFIPSLVPLALLVGFILFLDYMVAWITGNVLNLTLIFAATAGGFSLLRTLYLLIKKVHILVILIDFVFHLILYASIFAVFIFIVLYASSAWVMFLAGFVVLILALAIRCAYGSLSMAAVAFLPFITVASFLSFEHLTNQDYASWGEILAFFLLGFQGLFIIGLFIGSFFGDLEKYEKDGLDIEGWGRIIMTVVAIIVIGVGGFLGTYFWNANADTSATINALRLFL